ncbi:MAG: biotin transporter BioY [Nevskia sp.]|nr:biotin transporter BioY [Nevskia sp.]
MLRLMAAVIFTSATIASVFVTLPLPFIGPAAGGVDTISVWSWDHGWALGLHQQTLQPLITLAAGLTLGAFLGGLSQLLYLLLGLGGLAVFTQGGGWAYWQQPTMGFLLALAPAATVTALLAGRSRRAPRLFRACLGGLGTLYLLGLPYAAWIVWPDGAARRHEFIAAFLLTPLPGQIMMAFALAGLAALARTATAGVPFLAPQPRTRRASA